MTEQSNKPFITVTVLCYNYGHLLGRCLNALAAQTFRDFDVVVVNNGSTDDTAKVYADFAAAHPELSLRCVTIEKNIGLPHGRNAGFDAADGEYVMMCDADDWPDADCLAVLAERAKATGADRVLGQYREVGSQGQVLRDRPFAKNPVRVINGSWHGSIFKRSIIEENHLRIPEELFYSEDYCFILNFTVCSKTFCPVHKTIFNYYFNTDSLTSPKMYDARKRLGDSWNSLVEVCRSAADRADAKTAVEIEYLLLKHYYPALVTLLCNTSGQETKEVYRLMHEKLLAGFPHYTANAMLTPFPNGHPLSSRVCCWGMRWVESLRLLWVLQGLLRLHRPQKLVRV